jgi:ribosomal-protein-alanine N-acetyltransferase
VGYGGMWFIAGEAHISTIAVHPKGRGRGWGEILLAGMVQRGIRLDADEVALEVRVTNKRAQKLYEKYAFRTVDVKKRYYRNNNEDAYDMRLNVQDEPTCAHFKAQYDALFKRHQLIDDFSLYAPPHVRKSP